MTVAYDKEIVAKLAEDVVAKIKSTPSNNVAASEQAKYLSRMGFTVSETAENKLRQLKMEEDEFVEFFDKETEKRSKEAGITLSTDNNIVKRARTVYRTLLEQDAILNGYSIDFIMELRREHSAYRLQQLKG